MTTKLASENSEVAATNGAVTTALVPISTKNEDTEKGGVRRIQTPYGKVGIGRLSG